MRLIRGFGNNLELDIESYIDSGTEFCQTGLRLAVVGPEDYVKFTFLSQEDGQRLLGEFNCSSPPQLIGCSVYAIYKNKELKTILPKP
jgi:hypothetical protein